MKRVLSFKDQRMEEILTYLIQNNDTTLPAISHATFISPKTISATIERLNTIISPVTIYTDTSGVHLDIPANYSARYMYQKLLEYSFEYRLLEYIFTHKGIHLEECSRVFFLSPNTIRRSIHHINQVIETNNFQITTRKALCIEGDARSITSFFATYFNERYTFIDDFINENEVEAIQYIINHSKRLHSYFDNYQDRRRISILLYVRIQSSKLCQLDTFTYPVDITIDRTAQDLFLKAFNLALNSESISYFFEFINTNTFAFTLKQAISQTKLSTDWKNMFEMILAFLDKITIEHDFQYSNYDRLVIDIFNMLRQQSLYSFILYDRNEIFLRHLKDDELNFYTTTLNLLDTTINVSLTETQRNEVLYLIFSHWNNLFNHFYENQEIVVIGIFTDSDSEHSSLLKDTLKKEYKFGVEIETLDTTLYSELIFELNHIDLLITNIPNLSHTSCEVLCIEEYPKYDDYISIDKKIQDIRQHKTHIK